MNDEGVDAVSQSFLKMMEHIERISALPCHQRAPYCVIIVKNVCIDMLRKRKTIEPIEQAEWLEQAEDNKDMLWTSIDKTELMDAMSLLPIDDRKLIQLRFANEMSYREIARLFGISEDTAKKRGQRAIDKLRKCYEEKNKCLN